MPDTPRPDEPEHRFELRKMLREIEAEAKAQPQGPVKQSEILEMIRNRKKRDSSTPE